MSNYKVIGIDLAKRKLHFAAINLDNKVVLKKAMDRKSFFENLSTMFLESKTFVFEACGGAHYMAQRLESIRHICNIYYELAFNGLIANKNYQYIRIEE